MKTFLQQYESKTRYLLAASLAVLALGIYIYAAWSSLGGYVAGLGAIGLVWCFLRR